MSFKYNDKLVIRDRQQMEDLFKHRLDMFDSTRTKKLIFSNHTGILLTLLGKFDRKNNALLLEIHGNCANPIITTDYVAKVNKNFDINIPLGFGDIGSISLITHVDIQDE